MPKFMSAFMVTIPLLDVGIHLGESLGAGVEVFDVILGFAEFAHVINIGLNLLVRKIGFDTEQRGRRSDLGDACEC